MNQNDYVNTPPAAGSGRTESAGMPAAPSAPPPPIPGAAAAGPTAGTGATPPPPPIPDGAPTSAPPPPLPPPHPAPAAPPPPVKRRRSGCCLGVVILFVLALGALCGGVLILFFVGIPGEKLLGETASGKISEEVIMPSPLGLKSKIAVIDIKGIIAPTGSLRTADSRRISFELAAARKDPEVVAIVLDMNTPGGEVTASDELHREVLRCREAGKPVVTCMRSLGASGGYFIAAGSDWIVANRLTLTGSVGVIISTVNYRDLFAKIGLQSEVYRSGPMKDMLNGARERRPDEAAYVQSLVNETFREFAAVVAAGRKRYRSADEVMHSSFGDGRILSGTRAKELGLVDQIGYFEDAVGKARQLSGTPGAAVVHYQRAVRFFDLLLSMKAPKSVRIEGLLPAEIRCLEPGRLYFLMSPPAP